MEDLLAAGFRLNAPAGPDSPDVPPLDSVAGSDGGRQEHGHGQGDDVSALGVAEAEHGRLLAEAEAGHLRAQLGVRAEQLAAQAGYIADLQQTVRALMTAPERFELRPSVPGQVGGGRPAGPDPQGPEAAGGERR